MVSEPLTEVAKLARRVLKTGGDFPHKYAAETAALKLATEIVRLEELWQEFLDGDGKRG